MSIAKICSIDSCGKKHNAKGYCKSHYDRWLVFGDAEAVLKYSNIHEPLCSISGCKRSYYANRLCRMHYDRVKRTGDVGVAESYVYGNTKHPLYVTYRKMLERCYSPSCPAYPDYGGRGIKVCNRWLERYGKGFSNFAKDMGEKPTSSHSIDRIDNDKGYSPGNCKWSTKSEQAFNRRMYTGSRSIFPQVRDNGKGKYVVYGSIDGTRAYIGTYTDLEEAISSKIGYQYSY